MARFGSMNRAVGLIVAIACTGVGCGDSPSAPPPAPALTDAELMARLSALPGVTVERGQFPDDSIALAAEFRYYILRVTQPIDHDDASQGTFEQMVRLLHRDERVPNPMVVNTTGYADLWGDKPVELTTMLTANQISIEHRFYGASVPRTLDWSKLTIEQMAADEHEVITALRTIYGGAFVSTGGSKGGMTAVFHRRFWPADVDGTVAYVAPLSWAASDPVYQTALDQLAVTPCRQAVRAAAIDMLANHRDELIARASAEAGRSYSRVLIGPAVEGAVADLEWSFWVYAGLAMCDAVPPPGATVDQLYAFLERVSSVMEYDDDNVATYEPYVYQSHTQLGYPSEEPTYLEDAQLLTFTEADYAGELPLGITESSGDDHGSDARGPGGGGHGSDDPPSDVAIAFDPQAMIDIDGFVESRGDRLMFLYGGGDPWSARRFLLGNATNSAVFVQPEGTHRVQLGSLALRDRQDAFDMLAQWTGVAPVMPHALAIGARAPRVHAHAPRAGK
jgi:hypothetical protein